MNEELIDKVAEKIARRLSDTYHGVSQESFEGHFLLQAHALLGDIIEYLDNLPEAKVAVCEDGSEPNSPINPDLQGDICIQFDDDPPQLIGTLDGKEKKSFQLFINDITGSIQFNDLTTGKSMRLFGRKS